MKQDISIELLRAFRATVEGGSLTAAARALNRSQSALSMQLKRLEETVGGILLERNSQGIALTRHGEMLLAYASRMVALNDEMIGQLRQETPAGIVRLGAIEDYAVQALPRILASFISAHPHISIETETGFSAPLIAGLGNPFDLVLAMHPDGSRKGAVVRRERAIWLGSRQHAIHDQTIVSLALHPAGCQFRKVALEALDGAQRPWRLAYSSQSLAAIEAAVAAGLAITVTKAGAIPKGLCALGSPEGLPPLPFFEISLHRAPASGNRAATALAHHIELALRDGSI